MADGFIIMGIGMSVVFTFLIIMVMVMIITSQIIKIVNKRFPEQEELQEGGLKRALGGQEEIAVVLAAVKTLTKNN